MNAAVSLSTPRHGPDHFDAVIVMQHMRFVAGARHELAIDRRGEGRRRLDEQ
jgi:hypothetical protein